MKIELKWDKIVEIPALPGESLQHGLAGALTGVYSDKLVVAGGSNFPDARPWEGGTKTYYDRIFFIELEDEKAEWKVAKAPLPFPIAYSACVAVPGGIISIGGENQDGLLSSVFKIREENEKILLEKLPDFPIALSNVHATLSDSLLYVAGVSAEDNTIPLFYSANITEETFKWTRLPDMPMPISNAIMLCQWDGKENCIYMLGGRNKEGKLTKFYTKVWKYSPGSAQWQSDGEIETEAGNPVPLAAGTGVAVHDRFIVLVGGDNGDLYNITEELIYSISVAKDQALREKVIEEKVTHLANHRGFDHRIFLYDTHTKKCSHIGDIPVPVQLTTTAVKHGDKIIIPNGEIKPGIRTAEVNCMTLKINDTE